MRQTPTATTINLGDVNCDRLAYADDVDLCGEDFQELQHMFGAFKEGSSGIGLKIREEKTKILKVSRQGSEIGNIACAGLNLEGVDKFKYLGSTVTSDNRVEEEIKIRIATGSKVPLVTERNF